MEGKKLETLRDRLLKLAEEIRDSSINDGYQSRINETGNPIEIDFDNRFNIYIVEEDNAIIASIEAKDNTKGFVNSTTIKFDAETPIESMKENITAAAYGQEIKTGIKI